MPVWQAFFGFSGARSLLFSKITLILPKYQGDGFVSDCAHHHPVPPNCRFPDRLKTGRLCGDFRRFRSALSVSGDPCGLSGRFLPPVSASKNSVPRGRVLTANAGRLPEILGVLEAKSGSFRARLVVIADLIRALRTAGSILREHRATVRLRCRVANGLRPRRARGLVRGTRAISSC
jgi:hypothetical protein